MGIVVEFLRAVAALLWPIFAFYVFRTFRGEIRELLGRVRKGKVMGTEFEFEAHAAALNADRKADAALASLSAQRGDRSRLSSGDRNNELRQLAVEYDRLRNGPKPASGTSPIVSDLVGRMIRAASGVAGFDVQSAIRSTSQGERLSGYAYMYEHPSADHVQALVAAIAHGEPTGNGQYWAIQALAKSYPFASDELRREVLPTLRGVVANYQPGSDRAYALRKVIDLQAIGISATSARYDSDTAYSRVGAGH